MRAILRQAVSGGTPPLLREGDALVAQSAIQEGLDVLTSDVKFIRAIENVIPLPNMVRF